MPAPTVLPGGSISQADACRMLLAALKAGTGSAIPPGVGTAGGAPVAAQDAEHASFASSGSSGTVALAVAVLAALLLGLATAVIIRRRRATRPSSGEPPSIEG